MPDRSKLKKDDLLEELEQNDTLIAELNGAIDVVKEAHADDIADLKKELASAKKARKKGADPNHGLMVLVYHVGGVHWNGTHRRLVRCMTGGPMVDKWLVQIGATMITTSGHPIPFMPYVQVSKSLQPKVGWDLEAGIAYLGK